MGARHFGDLWGKADNSALPNDLAMVSLGFLTGGKSRNYCFQASLRTTKTSFFVVTTAAGNVANFRRGAVNEREV